MEFLRLFLGRHLAEKPEVASRNVGFFLRLLSRKPVLIRQRGSFLVISLKRTSLKLELYIVFQRFPRLLVSLSVCWWLFFAFTFSNFKNTELHWSHIMSRWNDDSNRICLVHQTLWWVPLLSYYNKHKLFYSCSKETCLAVLLSIARPDQVKKSTQRREWNYS